MTRLVVLLFAIIKKIKSSLASEAEDISELQGNVEEIQGDILDLQRGLEAIPNGYNYKGSVATYDDLPNDPEVGDAYSVTNLDNAEYVWDGTSWIEKTPAITTAQIDALYE